MRSGYTEEGVRSSPLSDKCQAPQVDLKQILDYNLKYESHLERVVCEEVVQVSLIP